MSEDYSPYHLSERRETGGTHDAADRLQTPKRVAIYVRRSQLKQVGGTDSIQEQIELCKAYCAERGFPLSEDQIYYEALGLTTEAAEKQ